MAAESVKNISWCHSQVRCSNPILLLGTVSVQGRFTPAAVIANMYYAVQCMTSGQADMRYIHTNRQIFV